MARAMALTSNDAATLPEGAGPGLPHQHIPGPQPGQDDGLHQTSGQAPSVGGEVSDDEPPESDEDDMEVQVREGETVEQHSVRIKKLLKERIQRAKDRKEERKEGNKSSKSCKDGKDGKEGKGRTVRKPSVKK